METRLAKRRRQAPTTLNIVTWTHIFGFLNIVDPKDRVLRLLVPLQWHRALMTSWYKASRVEITWGKYERTTTVNGVMHNEDESTPAEMTNEGSKAWYWCGVSHRSGGLPSYLSFDGKYREYRVHGKLHREGGMPATEAGNCYTYYLCGKYIAGAHVLASGSWTVCIPKYRAMRFATREEATDAARHAMEQAQLKWK